MKAEWPRKRLSEVAELVGGSTPARDTPEYWGGEIPWVTPTDLPMPGEGIATIAATTQTITRAGLDSCAATLVPPGTVLFSSRATIGKLAVAGVSLTTNQGFANLIPRSIVTPRFLAYALWFHMEDIARLAGSTTFKEVSRGRLANFEIPLPPLAEQERIVQILDAAEELRRLRAQADRRTADLIPALFYQMFGDPATNTKGWEASKLGALCTIRRGASPRPIDKFLGGTIPWIKIGDGTRGDALYIEETSVKIIEEGRRKSVYLEPGSLIFANCGVSLGFARILKIGGCIHDGWLSLEDVSPRLDKIFLLKLINSLTHRLRQMAPDGTQPNLNTGIMKHIDVPVPSILLQRQFAAHVAEIRAFDTRQAESRRRLDDLFQSLLHRAFQGEL